jgi:L-amino acid N-acyltransferase YncA
MKIRPLQPVDYESVRKIYQAGIDTKLATFETQAPDWEGWQKKFMPEFQFVAELDGKIAGWVALSKVSERYVYRGVCEETIYISPDFQGRGVGKSLLQFIIAHSEEKGIWTLQAGIFAKNNASIHLHEKSGFRHLGIREKIGQLDGQWLDVVLMERRSKLVM